MKPVTIQQLRTSGACVPARAKFTRRFGKEARITLKNAKLAYKWGFCPYWFANHMLTPYQQRRSTVIADRLNNRPGWTRYDENRWASIAAVVLGYKLRRDGQGFKALAR